MKIIILAVMVLIVALPLYAKESIRSSEGVSAKTTDGEPVKIQDNYGKNIQNQLYSVDAPKSGKTIRIKEQENNLERPYSEEAIKAQINKIETRSDNYVLTEDERKLLNKQPSSSLVGFNIFIKLVTFILFGVGVGVFIRFFKKDKT